MSSCWSLCSPRNIVNVAERVNNHCLRVCSLIEPVTYHICHHSPDQVAMSRQMDDKEKEVASNVDRQHDKNRHLSEWSPVNTSWVKVQINSDDVVSYKSQHCKGQYGKYSRYMLSILRPNRPRQSPRYRYQTHYHINQSYHSSDIGYDIAGDIDLINSCIEDIEVDGRSEVTGSKGKKGKNHWEVELEVSIETVVSWFWCVEIVVFEDIKKSKKTAVYPSSSLFHQIHVTFHWICPCTCVRNVFQVELRFWLAVNTQG